MVSRLIWIDVRLLLSARSACTFADPNFIDQLYLIPTIMGSTY
jgi:hypothetical protein